MSPVPRLPLPSVVDVVNGWGDEPRARSGQGDTPYPDGRDPAPLVEVANLVHPVFAAPTPAELAERLTALVHAAGLTLTFEASGNDVREVWHADRPLLGAAVLALVGHLRDDPDAGRLGTCAGDDCVDVFVDHSRAGRRRYCSITCQNRARTRAYRAQRRG